MTVYIGWGLMWVSMALIISVAMLVSESVLPLVLLLIPLSISVKYSN